MTTSDDIHEKRLKLKLYLFIIIYLKFLKCFSGKYWRQTGNSLLYLILKGLNSKAILGFLKRE